MRLKLKAGFPSAVRSTFAFVLMFALLLGADFALAEDQTANTPVPELVVTPSRIPLPARKVGRDVATVTQEELENSRPDDLTNAIQSVPGVRMVNLGGPGAPGTTPLEIRGFRTGGTQLLYNGLTLSDPSSISGTYEQYFSFITLEDIQEVEVLRGATSVLYGSDGQGGAVNLIPTMPEAGTHAGASFQGGSFDTYMEGASLNYGAERGGLRTTVARVDSGGLDAHGNYENTTVSAIGKVDIYKDTLSITPLFRLIDAETDIDSDPFLDENGNLVPNQDTEKNNVQATAYIVGATLNATAPADVDSKLSVYYNDSDREFFFDFDGSGSTSEFKGRSFNVDEQTAIDLPDISSTLLVGFEFEHQETETAGTGVDESQQRDQTAGFVNMHTDLLKDTLHLAGGSRVTQISNTSKTNTSLEASAAYEVKDVDGRIHSSISQAFRAPTLFESNGTIVDFDTGELITVGNRHLNPEEALTWDVGYAQYLMGESLVADVTFFQGDADETIIFDFPNQTHVNGGSAKSQGIESSLTYEVNEWATLRAAYTNLDRAEGLDGERRQRTPRNWYNASATLRHEALTFFTEVNYRDAQQIEFFGEENRFRESGVTTCNATLSYAVTKPIELFVRAENIFDVDYTEAGYTMPGAAVYGGVRARL